MIGSTRSLFPKQKSWEETMPAAFFVVRATVPDPKKSFGAKKAWRFWSLTDPSIHQATYEFADEAALDRAMKCEDQKRLVDDFNRDWPEIKRTRETFVLAE